MQITVRTADSVTMLADLLEWAAAASANPNFSHRFNSFTQDESSVTFFAARPSDVYYVLADSFTGLAPFDSEDDDEEIVAEDARYTAQRENCVARLTVTIDDVAFESVEAAIDFVR